MFKSPAVEVRKKNTQQENVEQRLEVNHFFGDVKVKEYNNQPRLSRALRSFSKPSEPKNSVG